MTITKEYAVTWANSKIGQRIDYDGVYGAQCMDLVVAFCQENFNWRPKGNARDLATQLLPAGFERHKNTPDFLPLPGDIFIWTHDQFGHTGIITSATLTSYTSVEQNGEPPYDGSKPAKAFTRNYNNFWGVIRPNYASSNNNTPTTKGEITMQCFYQITGHPGIYYFDGKRLTGLVHIDEFNILNQIYQANNGKSMPHIIKDEAWFQRLKDVATRATL